MQIYIHIPFCEKKCSYCRFASIWSTQDFLIEKYVKYLCREIWTHPLTPSLVKRGKPLKIATIYFGWWTPGVLHSEQLQQILISLRKQYVFSDNIEITLETTPNHVTLENIAAWKTLWINRVSMWIQTLNEKSLDAIWRGGKWDIEKALTCFQRNMIKNISVDFIIWLPHVQKGELLRDINYILEKYNCIQHVSVYMLEDYYNEDKIIETWFDKKTYPENWDNLWLKECEYLEEYSSIKKYLDNKGFSRYEISNFAKNIPLSNSVPCNEGEYLDYRCWHNWGYWNHKEVRAFWLGAYWFENNIRYANSESFSEYYNWKRILEEQVTPEELLSEKIMFWLRTSWLEKQLYSQLDQQKLSCFIQDWFLEEKSDRIILSDRGVMVMDYILWEIIIS